MRPISIVESENVKDCIATFDSDYIVPSRYIMMKCIDKNYTKKGLQN